MTELLTGAAYYVFLVSAALTIISVVSRPGTKRFGRQRYSEIVRYNPPAAFFAALGRGLPLLLIAMLASGAVLLLVLATRAIV